MTVYRVEIKLSAQKELAQLPRQIAEKIASQIKALAENPRPHGCKKLVDKLLTINRRALE